MKALILHANNFQVNITEPSTRPYGIVPETQKSVFEKMSECMVVFFCVEKDDSNSKLNALYRAIINSAKGLGVKNIMLAPFVHLSSRPAKPEQAKQLYFKLLDKLKKTDFDIKASHFGYHKSLLLDIKGHPGSFRYREF